MVAPLEFENPRIAYRRNLARAFVYDVREVVHGPGTPSTSNEE
jgi:hypothetical protein